MDQLKIMKEQLIAQVQGQMGNLSTVDAKEMGEVVDMIKDLAEAAYYCAVTEAMEESKEEKKQQPMYYTPYLPYEKSYIYNPYRDMDIENGRMYYSGGNGGNSSGGGQGSSMGGGARQYSGQYPRDSYPMMVRDYREGRSPIMRKNYMESKEMHHDKATQMKELEDYIKELSKDITEMIEDATPEEKAILKQKMTQLTGLIV